MTIITQTTDRWTNSHWSLASTASGTTTVTQGDVRSVREYKTSTYDKRPKPKKFKLPTAYSMSYRSGVWESFPGYNQARNRYNNVFRRNTGADYRDWLTIGNISLGSLDPATKNKAILKARMALKDQKINLAVAFKERKQVVSLFLDTAKHLTAAIHAARRLDPKGLKKALGMSNRKITHREKKILKQYGKSTKTFQDRRKAAGGLWLANAFGAKPLIQDVSGAAQLLAQYDSKEPQRYRSTVRGRATKLSRNDKVYSVASVKSIASVKMTVKHSWKSKAMVRIDAFLVNPALSSAASLGLLNPYAVAWEVMPWSFFIDYMLPIGAYLEAMDATLGWSFLSGSTSEKLEGGMSAYVTAYPTDGDYDNRIATGVASNKYGSLTRTPLFSFPYPTSILPKNPLSTGHVANALALLLAVR